MSRSRVIDASRTTDTRMFRPLALALVLVVSACASSSSIRPSDGRAFRVQNRSYSQVWNAAILTIASVGAIESQSRRYGEVRGHRGASAWSWGEAIAVFIVPPSEAARDFTVTVVSEHIMQTQISGQDFGSTMISTMKAHLDLY